ncbi:MULTISPECIES: cupin domain-containing protein [Rhizobium]|uniref:cupin domain-containing protein n=1 Tax=Rhizobium TaxID=379 RepID=UPI0007EA1515|nr:MULTISPECIES: cupin domain-containing protein [Rhizobium]ANK91063.1 cupin 2 domain-containing protein [Rhizobium sp. N6212]ANK97094.1 cupin 2 domain-containing protein [Rhizobium sp. N621]ANL03214.1 cupin 2 domain-containing protein [Rhizobium esperanzae]ANL09261.1 cupin 2 domain-containing protein [Rhizobium sp. N1341]ANL21307.1 cupin 2 domain-containing protein [Rhizobium sp. N113]
MAAESKAVINIADLKLDYWKQGEFYEGADVSFGVLLGLAGLGISYNEVPSGKSSCPLHNHHVEDELFYVIAGTGEYRFGSERHPVRAGDVLGAPAGGPETAHQLINTGTTTLIYLGISTMAKTEIVEYPDSGKFLARTNRDATATGRFRHIGRTEGDLDYWDGEPGA